MKRFQPYLPTILILTATTGIFMIYLSITNFDELPTVLNGSAGRPLVYRLLVPKLASAGANLLPAEAIDALRNTHTNTVITKSIHETSGGKFFGEAFCTLIILYLSLLGFIFAEKSLLRDLGYSTDEQIVIPLTLALMILPLSIYFAYYYDLPQLFFFSASLLYLQRRNWIAYLLLFAVSILNKETSFFLTIIFVIYFFRRLPLKSFVVLAGLQLVIFVLLRAAITYAYRDSPGVAVYWSFKRHIDQYVTYPPSLIFTLAFFGIMLFLMFKDFSRKPLFLRYASSVFILMLVLFFLTGMPFEFRIFIDILPIFGVMMFLHRKAIPSLEQQVDPKPTAAQS